MKNNDLISVIIPICNGEKYIDKCLSGWGGILNQSYRNIEVILVPNNCTDHSVEKCNEWAQKDKRVKVFVNLKKGTSLARKRGILESQGEYILFVDCDDRYIDNESIRNMYEAIKHDGTQICQFGHYNDYGLPFYKKVVYPFERDTIISREELLAGPIIGAALGRGGMFDGAVWSKIYHAAVLKDAVRNMHASLTQQEDVYLNAFVFSSDMIQTVSCKKKAYYVYKIGIGVSSQRDTMIMLLRGYQIIKEDIYKHMSNIPVRKDFNLRLWSEAVYCYRAFIYDKLQRKCDEKNILNYIREIESYNYIKMAKEFYKSYSGAERNDYIEFLCSNYSPEEYLEYCKRTMPKITVQQNIKNFIKRIVRKKI